MSHVVKRDASGRYAKGHGGRKPGTPNKKTQTIRQAFLEAFNDGRLGGTEGLVKWAMQPEHREAFYHMLTRLIPRELSVELRDVRPVMIDRVTPEDIEASYERHDIH